MNILCMGGRVDGIRLSPEIWSIRSWQPSSARAERHVRRLGKVAALEAHAVIH